MNFEILNMDFEYEILNLKFFIRFSGVTGVSFLRCRKRVTYKTVGFVASVHHLLGVSGNHLALPTSGIGNVSIFFHGPDILHAV